MPRKNTTPRKQNDDSVIGNIIHAVAQLQRDVALLESAATAAPVDKTKEVAALVGMWIDRQKASGQTTIDLKRVDDIRTGIELALT